MGLFVTPKDIDQELQGKARTVDNVVRATLRAAQNGFGAYFKQKDAFIERTTIKLGGEQWQTFCKDLGFGNKEETP